MKLEFKFLVVDFLHFQDQSFSEDYKVAQQNIHEANLITLQSSNGYFNSNESWEEWMRMDMESFSCNFCDLIDKIYRHEELFFIITNMQEKVAQSVKVFCTFDSDGFSENKRCW